MINTNEIAKEYRLSHWAQVMQERSERGLSIREYCNQIGIAENTYFYWQRRVRAAACEMLTSKEGDNPVGTDTALVPNGWAVCEAVGAKAGAAVSPLTVDVNGCRVHIESDTDLELLARVCRMLKSLC